MSDLEVALCMSYRAHLPHDWVYAQDWGGTKNFDYHCPGIKEIIFVTHEGEDVRRLG